MNSENMLAGQLKQFIWSAQCLSDSQAACPRDERSGTWRFDCICSPIARIYGFHLLTESVGQLCPIPVYIRKFQWAFCIQSWKCVEFFMCHHWNAKTDFGLRWMSRSGKVFYQDSVWGPFPFGHDWTKERNTTLHCNARCFPKLPDKRWFRKSVALHR